MLHAFSVFHRFKVVLVYKETKNMFVLCQDFIESRLSLSSLDRALPMAWVRTVGSRRVRECLG